MEKVRIRRRGRYSLEIKSRYLLGETGHDGDAYASRSGKQDTRKRQGRIKPKKYLFDVGIFFFLPYSFNIRPSTYPRESFFEELKLYLRFDTPFFTVSQLLDSSVESSPLVRCERLVRDSAREKNPVPLEPFVYESRLLGCVYKSLLRDWSADLDTDSTDAVGTRGRRGEREEPSEEAHFDDERLRVQTEHRWEVVRRFHRLLERLEGAYGSDNNEPGNWDKGSYLLQHARMLDEHLSLLLEKYFVLVLGRTRNSGLKRAEEKIEADIIEEMEYRRGKGYPSVTGRETEDDDFEKYIYREKMLKRYASKVLFTIMKKRNIGKWLEHVLFALAAGIAMLFATTIAFLGQTAFGNLSLSLFVLLVASYMLKDRMKDLFRELFLGLLGGRFYDRSISVLDPRHQKRLGLVRDRAFYVPEEKIDSRVMRLRNRAVFERVIEGTDEESILHYRKKITLNARRLSRMHRRMRGLADISVINLEPFFHSLASQRSRIPVIGEDGKIEFHQAKRIHHLNMVVHYRAQGGEEIHERRRLVVDGSGIRRIEPLPEP